MWQLYYRNQVETPQPTAPSSQWEVSHERDCLQHKGGAVHSCENHLKKEALAQKEEMR